MARTFLGLGSNQGDRLQHLRHAEASLARLVATRWIGMSPIYETEPVGGPSGQGPFLNAVAEVETTLEPPDLLIQTVAIETSAGRLPACQRQPCGPRPLDIDLLFYGDLLLSRPGLTIPHPRLHERWFVLRPLADLAPDLVHPLLKRTIAELLEIDARLASSEVRPLCKP